MQSLITYNSKHKFDFICLFESHINSEILSNDSNVQIPSYNFAGMNQPLNNKRGGYLIYKKCSLHLKVMDVSFVQECISFEIKISDKTCNFTSLYRTPNQAKYEFENFIKDLELSLEHIANKSPVLTAVLDNFNARMQGWYQKNITTFKGYRIKMATSQFSLSQKETKHILINLVSYIDLIFTSQTNLVMSSSIHPSLHLHCHHQIVFL